jgi:hemoglobin/transferrin/lactoferrin receptor protein
LYSMYSAGISNTNLNEEERQKPALYAQDANGLPYSPAWYTLNIKALAELSSSITLTAGLENITDQRYRPYSSGLAGPGANLVVALRARI